jgi:hypothetical protein
VYFVLQILTSFLLSGNKKLEFETIKALKIVLQGLKAVAQRSEKKAHIVEGCLLRFIMLVLSKIASGNLPYETKIQLVDLLVVAEQGLKDSFAQLRAIFEEANLVLCKDSELVRLYLLHLRGMWRETKQIPVEIIPKFLLLVKGSLEQLQTRKGQLTNQDNELISEMFKAFLYLQFEGNSVNKQAFPEVLLSFILIALELRPGVNTVNVIVQLMQHLYSNIPAPQVKQMLNSVNEEQRNVLCKVVPVLQTVSEQKIEVQAKEASASVAASGDKPVIKLMTFKKK